MVARSETQTIIFQPRCKMWSCDACGEINRDKWRFEIFNSAKHLIDIGFTIQFTTLTSHEKLSPDATLRVWPSAWKKLRNRAVYHTSRTFLYVMIPELHNDGRMHVHLLETSNLPQRFWKDAGRECGLGFQAKTIPLSSEAGAVYYVTKYLNKGLNDKNLVWPKHFRRVRRSQKWPVQQNRVDECDFTFEVIQKREMMQNITDIDRTKGKQVIICDHLTAWDYVRGSLDTENI